MEDNYLLKEHGLRFNAFPFDRISPKDFLPALEEAIKEKNMEIDKIVESEEVPTFENTILKYELSGQKLKRISHIFGTLYNANSTEEFKKYAPEIYELIIKSDDEDILNEKLFKRIKEIFDKRGELGITEDEKILTERTHESFVLAGANCPEGRKEELEEINVRLGKLYLKYSENIQEEVKNFNFVIADEKDIQEMPLDRKKIAKNLAEENGESGFLFLPNRSMAPLVMKYCNNRKLREVFFKRQREICYKENETGNQKIVKEISNLRLKIAKIFDCYKSYS